MNEIDYFPLPLFIKFSQLNRYVKYFNDSKYMNFEQNAIWNKIINLLEKMFDSELVYNDKYIKNNLKIYNDKTNTNFHANKIPEDNKRCTCLSVILLDSTVLDNKYHPEI